MRALGFSLTPFEPGNPGRLCRGRERWIDGYPIDPCPPMQRLVISGASFTDDTARDADRGLSFSGVRPGEILDVLYPDQSFLAFGEQGNPLHLPEGLLVREDHLQPRFGGARMDPCVRWRLPVKGAAEIDALFALDPVLAEGLVPFDGNLSPQIEEALFLLTGQAERLCVPERRVQPSALPALLDVVPFVIIAHLDKHSDILAVYGRDIADVTLRLTHLAESRGVLPVPFSIPPMLARWDRALFELRLTWERKREGSFPVPPGDEPDITEEREFSAGEE